MILRIKINPSKENIDGEFLSDRRPEFVHSPRDSSRVQVVLAGSSRRTILPRCPEYCPTTAARRLSVRMGDGEGDRGNSSSLRLDRGPDPSFGFGLRAKAFQPKKYCYESRADVAHVK